MNKKKFKKKFKRFLVVAFFTILKPWMYLYVTIFQHVRFKRNGFKPPKGPALFLSNHLSNWDGIYLNCMFMFRIIHFIVHEELYKNKFLSFMCNNFLGTIRRGMNERDISDVLKFKELAREGRNIGLYPEGDIDMFGRTLPIAPSIAKLVKMLNLPVVVLRVEGAVIRTSRWAKYARHSHITYSIKDVISLEEVHNENVDELYNRIVNNLAANDYDYVENMKFKQWRGKDRAMWLELGLFWCPKCGQFEALSSKKDKVFCTKCDFAAKYNRYGFLEEINYPIPSSVLSSWDDIQIKVLHDYIDNHEGDLLFEAFDLDFYKAKQVEYFKKPICRGSLRIYKDRIGLVLDGFNEEQFIYIKDMVKIYLQHKDVFEIHYGEDRIRFSTKRRKWSAYLYIQAVKYLKSKVEKK